MKRRFIEFDLPLAEISEESAREKSIRYGNPATLHPWWARRPLAASRVTVLTALLYDPGAGNLKERRQINKLIQGLLTWDVVRGERHEEVNHAREVIKKHNGNIQPRVLDPFAGGGAIPLEAVRLGCETYATDYNPVAVLIGKATVEWPQKFGIDLMISDDSSINPPQQGKLALEGGTKKVNLVSYLVNKWASKVELKVVNEIIDFYPSESATHHIREGDTGDQDAFVPVGYLWARVIRCQNPECSTDIPLIRQFWLVKKTNKRIAFQITFSQKDSSISFELLRGSELQKALDDGYDPGVGTIHRGNAKCPRCGQVIKANIVRRLAESGMMSERMIAVISHQLGVIGKKYRIATDKDIRVFNQARDRLKQKLTDWPDVESPLPNEELPPVGTLGFRINRYGMTKWKDLFNQRQQLSLVTFLEAIKSTYKPLLEECETIAKSLNVPGEIIPKELADAVYGYISLIFSRFLNRMTTLTYWFIQGEKIQPTFSRQALAMVWDFVEINPNNFSSGSWRSNIHDIVNVIESANTRNVDIHYEQASATHLPYSNNFFDAVITDPPYYDNVPYADLSDFFYVWLKRLLIDQFPQLFSTPLTPKSQEIIMEPKRHKSSIEAKNFYELMLGSSFQEVHRVLKPDGVAVIVYAHKTTAGWETMLNALIDSGLVVTGSWPIRTEMKTRLRAAKSAALASSIYMVCRKTSKKGVGFWNEVQPLIKSIVEEKLELFWSAGVTGGDFFISAIGPGMEAFSGYQLVETYDGQEVGIPELLEYIRSVASDYLINALLKDASPESIDKEAQFYLTYRWTYLDNTVPFDDARKIASAEGVDIERFWDEGDFIKKSGANITVLGPKERNVIKSINNMVDAMHRACQIWEQDGKKDVETFLAVSGYGASGAFWQFCQAVAECLLVGCKEKQLLEGLLLGKDQYQKAASEEKPEQLDLDM